MEDTAINGVYERACDYYGLLEAFQQMETDDYVIREISELLKPRGCKTVLDCSCNTGILAVGLAKAGFEVTASDMCEDSLAAAMKRAEEAGVSIRFVNEDVRNLHESFCGFDAVVCWNSEIARFKEGASMRLALNSIHQCLRDGGIAIFETNYFDELMDAEDHLTMCRVRATGLDVDGKRGSIIEIGNSPVAGDPLRMVFLYILDKVGAERAEDFFVRAEFAPIEMDVFCDYLKNAGFSEVEAKEEGGTAIYTCIK